MQCVLRRPPDCMPGSRSVPPDIMYRPTDSRGWILLQLTQLASQRAITRHARLHASHPPRGVSLHAPRPAQARHHVILARRDVNLVRKRREPSLRSRKGRAFNGAGLSVCGGDRRNSHRHHGCWCLSLLVQLLGRDLRLKCRRTRQRHWATSLSLLTRAASRCCWIAGIALCVLWPGFFVGVTSGTATR
jgi:hypothetical protein